MASASSSFRYIAHVRECVICTDALKSRVVVLNCGHVFHEECLDNWRTSNGTVAVVSVDEPVANTEKCPECRSFLHVHKTYRNYIDYKGKLSTEGKSYTEKRAIEKKNKKNKKRFDRKQRKLARDAVGSTNIN